MGWVWFYEGGLYEAWFYQAWFYEGWFYEAWDGHWADCWQSAVPGARTGEQPRSGSSSRLAELDRTTVIASTPDKSPSLNHRNLP
jgi:hypothetical protein